MTVSLKIILPSTDPSKVHSRIMGVLMDKTLLRYQAACHPSPPLHSPFKCKNYHSKRLPWRRRTMNNYFTLVRSLFFMKWIVAKYMKTSCLLRMLHYFFLHELLANNFTFILQVSQKTKHVEKISRSDIELRFFTRFSQTVDIASGPKKIQAQHIGGMWGRVD